MVLEAIVEKIPSALQQGSWAVEIDDITDDSRKVKEGSLFEQMARYDVSDEACRKINADYGMEAYDENLDYYAEKAMNEASGEYESLIEDAEPTVREALDSLDSMIESFQRLYDSLHQLLEVNSKIDNTWMN